MEGFKVILIIAVFASASLFSTAAPAAVVLQSKPAGVPSYGTINVTPKPNNRATPILEEEVKTLERFYRVYEDGTTEWKIVLSSGLAQYQKITNKPICGKVIQVYEGYYSDRLPDNSYLTTYYIADENGYRRLRQEFDTKPPVLPVYVPHVPKVGKVIRPLKCGI